MKSMINHNRTCNLADFRAPDIRELIRAIFAHEIPLFPAEYPDGVADSKQWEIAMGIRALREFGALRPDARMLGIGAGTEATTFYLSRHVRQVVATDIYAGAGPWADVAPSGFLADPTAFAAGIACDPRRILPLHQDARALDLPDDEYDGVYSSGSIEHFGSLAAVANAAHEIGRVLRPGGIATIATEFKVAGPPDGDGVGPPGGRPPEGRGPGGPVLGGHPRVDQEEPEDAPDPDQEVRLEAPHRGQAGVGPALGGPEGRAARAAARVAAREVHRGRSVYLPPEETRRPEPG